MYFPISDAMFFLIFAGRCRLWLMILMSIGIFAESTPLASALERILFHMILLMFSYLGQLIKKWSVFSIPLQCSHSFSARVFLSIGSWSFNGPLPIRSWWKIFCISLDGGREFFVSKDTEASISFRCLPVVEWSQMLCHFSIVASLILDFTGFMVMVADRGELFIIAPTFAALSANSLPIMSMCPPI